MSFTPGSAARGSIRATTLTAAVAPLAASDERVDRGDPDRRWNQAVAVGHSVEAAGWVAETDRLLARIAPRFPRVETRGRAVAFVHGLVADLSGWVTEGCGLGWDAKSGGNANGDLRIKICNVLGASLCLTACGSRATSGRAPQIMLSTAEKLVAQHSQHLAGFDTHRPRG